MKKIYFLCLLFLYSFFVQAQKQEPRLVLPVGHLGGITKLDCSLNEKLILTEDLNSDIIIIDSDKLIELQRHNYGNWKITSSTFLNDSSVISICNDTLVAVWNFYTDKVDLYPTTVPLNKVYVEKHGLYCINNQGNVFRFEISEKQLFLKKFTNDRANEVYFKSEKEIFLVNGKKLLLIDLNHGKQIKRKFDNQITALSWNNSGNVSLGFENGQITELDSCFRINHSYKSDVDKISSLSYIESDVILSGSYSYNLIIQNKDSILQLIPTEDWVIGTIIIKNRIFVTSWNGGVKVFYDLSLFSKTLDFKSDLKVATSFLQKEKSLFISYNDGTISEFDANNYTRVNQYDLSNNKILGFDVNDNISEFISFTNDTLIHYDLKKNRELKKFNVFGNWVGKFQTNSNNFLFSNDGWLYLYKPNFGFLDSTLIDTWNIIEIDKTSLLITGENKIILLNENQDKFYPIYIKDIGYISFGKMAIDSTFLFSLAGQRKLIEVDRRMRIVKKKRFEMDVIEIEKNPNFGTLILTEDGSIEKFKGLNSKVILKSQMYGSWDFLISEKTNKLIFPNSKVYSLNMDIEVYDNQFNKVNILKNVGGEVICVFNSMHSIDFNHIDSNQVIFIVTNGCVKLWDFNTDGKAPITQLGFDYYNLLKNELKDFNIDGAFLKSGLLKLPIPGVDALTYMNLKNGDWLVHDSKYRFDGTPGAIDKLYFTCGLEIVELNQVKDSLYVPNLVQRYTNGENLDRLPKLSDLNICGVTPILDPIDKGDGVYHYEITPRTGEVGDIEIYLNGVVRQTENAKRLKLKNGKYSIQVDPKLIELYQIPGEALQVKVIAKTANNSISSRGVVLDLESDEPTTLRKPSLHAVMIGVDDYKDDNLDLNYAAKDANDLHQALEQASKKFFNVDDTNRVFFYNLTINREAKIGTNNIKGKTPAKLNIIQTLEEIEKKSKPEDILLLFFAGHGEIVDKDQLKLLTAEATSTNFEGIRMRELLEQLNKIPAGKRVLILDACHSGAAINNLDYAQLTGKRDVKDAERQSQRLKELDKLASKSGFAIITASSSDQKALELPQYEHGLMTYALLNAMLNNKSSLDENNQLQLDKWLIATEEEVKKLNQNQSAERMVPVSFTLGKIDDEVRSSIVLKEIPTVFVNNVLNIDLGFDDQKIKDQLIDYFAEKSRGSEKSLFISEIEQPNSVNVNVVYTISKNEITLKATLLKNNEVIQRIEKNGNLISQTSLLNELIALIEKYLE
jgi:hypothetical protein